MISCDTIIENDSLILRNLNKNALVEDEWSSGSTAYNFYVIRYKKMLVKGHWYYYRCQYKYTTTNQNPTWASIYIENGSTPVISSRLENPVANTEYTLTGCAQPTKDGVVDYGNIYNGPWQSISGVTAYAKNVLCYDVTYLYSVLRSLGVIKDEKELETWCDNNLDYVNCGVDYDIRDKIADLTKVTFIDGNMSCEPIECDGMEFYCVNSGYRGQTYFDTTTYPLVTVYNNAGNNTVKINRVSAKEQGSPFYPEHQYVMKVETTGTAQPGAGGFLCQHMASENRRVIEKFVAKIPVGYNVTSAYNSQGTGSKVSYLTPREGTGKWEEYGIYYECGSGGTYASGGHVYLSSSDTTKYPTTAVTWYVAYLNSCDITGNEELRYYSALPNKDIIKGNKVFSKRFNTANYIPNGECTDLNMTLPAGWEYDTEDVAGNGKASIVQPVGVKQAPVFGNIKINPKTKYKLSFWVKCKADMTSYLCDILPYAADGKELNITQVRYQTGTRTTLTQDLVSGDTEMKVKSNANWVNKAGTRIGFRTYNKGYNDVGTFGNYTSYSTGIVSGITGSDTVLFNVPYTGATIAAKTYVVESLDGGYFPYPIQKRNLPTDNTWKYVEGYFGGDTVWDGDSSITSYSYALSKNTDYIRLQFNHYTNDGTVPIKFCDIRLEQVGSYGDGERHENKIQFIKHS